MLVQGSGLTFGRDGGGGTLSTAAYTAGTVYLVSVVINGASSELRINGSGLVTGTLSTTNSAWTGLTIGSNCDSPGLNALATDVYRVIVAAGAMNGTDRAAVESYLISRYSL